ncbi:MAG: hypothetical protein J3R72DRAFT_441667 [Linnemannia gamsii]|nr:MAG: hypothetical protein J3R72DRAFT_441667 [Linnemannia gamsii]
MSSTTFVFAAFLISTSTAALLNRTSTALDLSIPLITPSRHRVWRPAIPNRVEASQSSLQVTSLSFQGEWFSKGCQSCEASNLPSVSHQTIRVTSSPPALPRTHRLMANRPSLTERSITPLV